MTEEDTKQSIFRVILNASALGINFVLCVVIGAIIGYFIDKVLHSFPWFSIIFLIAGFAAGIKEIFRYIRKVNKTDGQGSNKEDQ
ncbi:MAG TPA: AtpZ/AtpI family protein [Thermodesulfovibrio thiophilus]|uniref:AtpZ/AtpI family protein n=1 Tax=Thermodesulfovibrio thiophilus TaxID=340095 RepID=UPI00040B0889|nr:AtpZ/AtpI family protein [Thermodesulfovibrio thiophilus]HHW20334.1 AtpZ/AtpI family protein [Thermodesulfovibrio thiophilus]HOA82663.1 AtpZ/AtpI family protein [Thermodesulfovibrio thiophilus]HQA03322.1 AtpZ/AtpI family protein [Thermodesulfovibrio thiophilus]HQD35732.1 AtpZ/AtpI family protein [Thermodesulfovibrio thiophilus]